MSSGERAPHVCSQLASSARRLIIKMDSSSFDWSASGSEWLAKLETHSVISVLAALALGLLAFQLLTGPGRNSSLKEPPSVFGIPYIYDEMLPMSRKGFADVVDAHFRRFKTSCFRLKIFGAQNYVVRDPRSIARLLNAEHELVEVEWTPQVKQLLGPQSVVTTLFDPHVAMRKAINPGFTPQASMQMLPGMVSIVQENVHAWCQQGQIQAQPCLKRLAFQVLIKAMLDFPPEFVKEGLMDRMLQLFQTWGNGFLAVPLRIPGSAFGQAVKAHEDMIQIIEDNLPSLNANTSNAAGKTVLFDKVFVPPGSAGSLLSQDQQRDVAFNILFAGWETTASSMCFLFRELHANSKVMAELRAEQRQVVAQHGEELSEAAMSDMVYLAATIKENLRLNPIVAAVPRKTLADLEVDGYYIPKGHVVWLYLRDGLLNDERWVDKAGTSLATDRFNPERWLTDEGKRTGSFLPFGQGLRACLGMHSALLEMKVLLAVLARNYELALLKPDAPINMTAALPQFADGLLATVKPLA